MNAVQEIKTASSTEGQILPTFPVRMTISVESGLSSDEVIFKGLAENWQHATQHLSVLAKRYEHPAYKAILGMGCGIAPFILRELQRAPDRWFDALEKLTSVNPAQNAATFEDAVELWIKWGKDNKYIP
jgi:hypothetical protein